MILLNVLPKIDQPGPDPAPSSDAAAVGVVNTNPNVNRLVRVQSRPVGSTEPWSLVVEDKTGADGSLRFKAWGSSEYRVLAPATDTLPADQSEVATYDWRPMFADEFDGTTLGPAWSLRGGGTYRPDSTHAKTDMRAVVVRDGTARVRVIPDPDQPPGYYLAGHVGTQGKFEFTYGWAAARVKFHRYAGAHGSFWLQSPTGYQIGSTEIDVAEFFGSDAGEPDMLHNLYWSADADNDPEQRWRAQTPGTDWWSQYHVFAVNWQDDAYRFYVDGVRVGTARVGLSTTPKFLCLSLQAKDYEVGKIRPDTPYAMFVDWVRVWQQ